MENLTQFFILIKKNQCGMPPERMTHRQAQALGMDLLQLGMDGNPSSTPQFAGKS